MPADPKRGLLDTNILIPRHAINSDELPDEMAISAITLTEPSAGIHLVSGDNAQVAEERARRADVLQRAENEFDPIPFESEAARAYGRISAAVQARGRTPRRRVADLMIAAVAAATKLPPLRTDQCQATRRHWVRQGDSGMRADGDDGQRIGFRAIYPPHPPCGWCAVLDVGFPHVFPVGEQ